MTILIDPPGVLFTGVPGAASTSIEAALEGVPEGKWIAPKHTTVDGLLKDGILTIEQRRRLTVFCIVRNPFDMVHAEWHRSRRRWILKIDDISSIGGWSHEKKKQIIYSAAYDFSEFVKVYYGHAYHTKTKHSLFDIYTNNADMVFKFEEIDAVSNWLKDKFNINIVLGKKNKTEGRLDYWRDYDSLARKIISEVHKDDIEAFGYKF